jgi:hypothetical protein
MRLAVFVLICYSLHVELVVCDFSVVIRGNVSFRVPTFGDSIPGLNMVCIVFGSEFLSLRLIEVPVCCYSLDALSVGDFYD